MFARLKKPLEQGEHTRAILIFENGGDVTVDFAVEGIRAQSGGGMRMQHGH